MTPGYGQFVGIPIEEVAQAVGQIVGIEGACVAIAQHLPRVFFTGNDDKALVGVVVEDVIAGSVGGDACRVAAIGQGEVLRNIYMACGHKRIGHTQGFFLAYGASFGHMEG